MQTSVSSERSLSVRAVLGGVVTWEALLSACRELAAKLAHRLRERCLVYQEVTLAVETEEGTVSAANRFARYQVPANLCLHLQRLISRLCVPAPVEGLTVTVGGLTRAVAEQLALFGGRDPLREQRREKVCAAIGRKYALNWAGVLGVDRRERMLSFYDPLRQSGEQRF